MAPRSRVVFAVAQMFNLGHVSFGLEIEFEAIGAAALTTWDRDFKTAVSIPPMVACKVSE